MRVRFSQLVAVASYEFVIHWRRRGLSLVIAFFAVISLMNGLVFWVLKRDLFVGFLTTDPPLILLILTMPIIVADTIPKERQFVVRELMRSLPMPSGVYLIGKLLGVWILILGGLSGVAWFFELIGRLLHGSYNLRITLVPWLLGVVPLALFISGMSVLLSSGQPTRRRATLVGGVFALFSLFIFLTASGSLWQAKSVAHAGIALYLQRIYLGRTMIDYGFTLYSLEHLPRVIGIGIVLVVLVWLIAWSWMQWKERQ